MPQHYAGQQSDGSTGGLVWIIGSIIALATIVSYCDSEAGQTDTSAPVITPTAPAEATASEPPPQPAVDGASVKKAAAHVRLALDSEGFAGAMIYSQNCFASLERQFSWAKLDQCGAFDALVQLGSGRGEGFGPESGYFTRTPSEQRFLAAAQGSGVTAELVQAHFAEMETAALSRIPDMQAPPEAENLDVLAEVEPEIEDLTVSEIGNAQFSESDVLNTTSDEDLSVRED